MIVLAGSDRRRLMRQIDRVRNEGDTDRFRELAFDLLTSSKVAEAFEARADAIYGTRKMLPPTGAR